MKLRFRSSYTNAHMFWHGASVTRADCFLGYLPNRGPVEVHWYAGSTGLETVTILGEQYTLKDVQHRLSFEIIQWIEQLPTQQYGYHAVWPTPMYVGTALSSYINDDNELITLRLLHEQALRYYQW